MPITELETVRLAHEPADESFGSFAERRAEFGLQIPDPVYIITDLTDDLAPAECLSQINKIFRSRGYITEFTPNVHDVKEFDPIDGGFQLRQLAIGHDQPLDQYDADRAINGGKPAVFGVVVDPGVGTDRRVVVIETESGNRYVGPDNTVLALALARETITTAWAVNEEKDRGSTVTFQGRDRILKTLARLACGDKPEEMGYLDEVDPQTLSERSLTGNTVVRRDGYGNLKLWQEGFPVGPDGERPDSVTLTLPRFAWRTGLPRRRIKDVPVARTFGDVPHKKPLVYTGSSGEYSWEGNGHVEVAIHGGNAAKKYRLHTGDQIGMEWHYPSDPPRRRLRGLRRR